MSREELSNHGAAECYPSLGGVGGQYAASSAFAPEPTPFSVSARFCQCLTKPKARLRRTRKYVGNAIPSLSFRSSRIYDENTPPFPPYILPSLILLNYSISN